MQVNLDKWHHCTVDKQEFVKLLQKSDYQGFKHMFIFFGSLILFGYLAYATWGTWWTVIFFFIYVGSFFGQGNGTSLSVLVFFILGIYTSKKIKKYFNNSKFNNFF